MSPPLWRWVLTATTTTVAGMVLSLRRTYAAARNGEEDERIQKGLTTRPPLHPPVRDTRFRLELVQVVTRHGARTPITLLPNPAPNAVWYCEPLHLSVLLHTVDPSGDARTAATLCHKKIYTEGSIGLPGTCAQGQLTHLGVRQMEELGRLLRQRYVVHHALLPAHFTRQYVHVRSSDSERTQLSAAAIMLGLYPTEMRGDEIIEIHTLDRRNETMFGRSDCLRFTEMMKKIEKDPEFLAREKERADLAATTREALGQDPDTPVRWSSLFNTISSHIDHDIALPPGITMELYEKIAREAHWSISHMCKSRGVCRLAIGRFLHEMYEQAQQTLEGQTPVRFYLYSGHDSTLAPLANALRISPNEHPPVASYITLEVYSRQHSSEESQHFVRLAYNGVVRVPEGVMAVNEDGLIHWKDFVSMTQDIRLTQAGYRDACMVNGQGSSRSSKDTMWM